MRRFVLSMILPAAALTIAAAPTPNPGPTTSTPAKPAAATAPPAKKDLICRTREVTGSRMPVHECHTADEWTEIQRHGEDSLSLDAMHHFPSNGGN